MPSSRGFPWRREIPLCDFKSTTPPHSPPLPDVGKNRPNLSGGQPLALQIPVCTDRAPSKHEWDPLSKHLLSSYYVPGPGGTVGSERKLHLILKAPVVQRTEYPATTATDEAEEDELDRGEEGSEGGCMETPHPFFFQKQRRPRKNYVCKRHTVRK